MIKNEEVWRCDVCGSQATQDNEITVKICGHMICQKHSAFYGLKPCPVCEKNK